MKILFELFSFFIKFGFTAFGGPAAHIAMMEAEIVEKRKWLDHQHFLDLVGATNLIPGPNSTEMVMHIGYERGGFLGLVVAGVSFIFPATFITIILAVLYYEFGQMPEVKPFIYGIKPAILAIILSAILKLGKKALKNNFLIFLCAVTLLASLFWLSEVYAILAAGLLGIIWFYISSNKDKQLNSFNPGLLLLAPTHFFSSYLSLFTQVVPAATNVTLPKLFLVFFKVGAILFGTGLVLVAYLDAELVQALHWIERNELLNAIAVGQFTPGPVLSTSAFIGYQIAKLPGAILATVGIFLPSFLFVLILNPLIPKMRKSKTLRAFLDAVNVGAVAVMGAVLLKMGREVIIDWVSAVLVVYGMAMVFFIKKKIAAYWLVLTSAVLGYILLLIKDSM